MSLCFGMVVLALVVKHTCTVNCLKSLNKNLNERLADYKTANLKPDAYYVCKRACSDICLSPHLWGEWAVVRQKVVGGYMYETLIKAFTDEDDDFNRREAEELAEKLNEK